MNFLMGFILLSAFAAFLSTIFRNLGAAMIFNPSALMIVAGGTVLSIFVGFPFSRIKEAAEHVIQTFSRRNERRDVVKEIIRLARVYRISGIKDLEAETGKIKDDFLKRGIFLLANNYSNEKIREIMERELAIRVMKYNFSQNMLQTIARLAPSFGLAGTVIGLIKMFNNFHSVEAVTPIMGSAMMSTFYGVIISNLFVLPLSAKLRDWALTSEALMAITIEGIEAVANGEHPMKIEEKIDGFDSTREPRTGSPSLHRTEKNPGLTGS